MLKGSQLTQKAAMTKRKSQSEYELTPAQILLGIHLDELGLSFVREHQFCDDRSWRLDIAIPEYRLAVEISGGNWTGGHRRGHAQADEYDKLNRAQMLGWRCLQFTNEQVLDGGAKEFIGKFLEFGN
jgi:very-short-patch-repair endonuclease